MGRNDERWLTEQIIARVIRVHQTLGPGFLESIYRRSLFVELRNAHLATEVEKEVEIWYEGHIVGRHRIDIIVEGLVVLELKAVESLGRHHYAQIRSYLKAARLRVGLLVNFSGSTADFRRVEIPPSPPSPQSPRSPQSPKSPFTRSTASRSPATSPRSPAR
jgi:GxxExxY protein